MLNMGTGSFTGAFELGRQILAELVAIRQLLQERHEGVASLPYNQEPQRLPEFAMQMGIRRPCPKGGSCGALVCLEACHSDESLGVTTDVG